MTKQKKLRKHTLRPIEKLKTDADRAVQDFFRATYPDKRCEVCGGPFQVVHHPIPKSLSARLRYDEKNFAYICHSCHFAHHRRGDPHIHATLIKKRGQKWMDNLEKLRREYLDINNRKFLECVLAKYALKP